MKLTDDWFTALSYSEAGQLVFVTVRRGLDEFIASRKLKVRVDISLPYDADKEGMPSEESSVLIEEIEPLLRRVMERDKLAILMGNYTGAGQKDWVFYTRHLPTFGERLNECLAPFPTLPLQIHCEEDPDWDDYHEMLALEQDDEEDPISVE